MKDLSPPGRTKSASHLPISTLFFPIQARAFILSLSSAYFVSLEGLETSCSVVALSPCPMACSRRYAACDVICTDKETFIQHRIKTILLSISQCVKSTTDILHMFASEKGLIVMSCLVMRPPNKHPMCGSDKHT